MEINRIAVTAAQDVAEAAENLKEQQIENLVEKLNEAKRVYVTGAGRSLLIMRCFAMRLMHLGFESYVVGDTTTPAFLEGDFLLAASGSGETSGLLNTAAKARKLGGTIGAITIRKESSLGRMADVLVEVPAYTAKADYEGMKKGILPSGSLFEQTVLILTDSLVLPLAQKKGVKLEGEFRRHANLE